MKTRKNIYFKVVALAAIAIAFAMPAKAQLSDNGYANIDWQFNVPLSNNFADKASGWGMNFEGGYYVLPDLSIGAFINYHTNNEYIPRQTLPINSSSALTTDQQHSVFQLPFGLATRYAWNRGGAFQPYVGVKLGTQYAQLKSTFNVFEANKDTWGFYVSPEIGFNVYPWAYGPGLHFAAYYSYGTNKGCLLYTSPSPRDCS